MPNCPDFGDVVYLVDIRAKVQLVGIVSWCTAELSAMMDALSRRVQLHLPCADLRAVADRLPPHFARRLGAILGDSLLASLYLRAST